MQDMAEICPYCGESILPDEEVRPINNGDEIIHHACLTRSIVGSVGHQLGVCQCFGGSSDGDPPGKSKREGALCALAFFEANTRGPRAPLSVSPKSLSYDEFISGVVDHLLTFSDELLPLAIGALAVVELGEQKMEIMERFVARKKEKSKT